MEYIQSFFDPKSSYFFNIVSLFFALLALLVLRTFKSNLLSQSKGNFIGASLFALYRPAKSFLYLVLIWLGFNLLNGVWLLNIDFTQYPVFKLLAVIHISWYGFRVVNILERATLSESETGKLDSTAVIGIAKVSRLFLTVVLVIVAFELIGLDASGLITLGGVSGAALAFASKDLVSNWFGGIMLYLDKPFKVGDWIRSPDREIEGTVEYIGWRISKIRTFDKRPLYVPNALFNNITVQNPSRMTHRRIQETIGVRYQDIAQVDGIVAEIKAYLQASELIAQDQTIIVNFNGFGTSSLNILVYCMTVTIDWVTFHQHKQIILLDIAKIVESHGGEFAFPTQTIFVNDKGTEE